MVAVEAPRRSAALDASTVAASPFALAAKSYTSGLSLTRTSNLLVNGGYAPDSKRDPVTIGVIDNDCR